MVCSACERSLLFFAQKIFCSIRTKYLFNLAWVWKPNMIVCLFWQSFTITFRLRVFAFFALVAFSSLLKIKGCHVFLGFLPLGVFEFPPLTFLGFPPEGWLYRFFVRERRGGLCCVLGRFPSSLLCVSGCFPSPFLSLSLTPHIPQKYTQLHTRYWLYTRYLGNIHTLTQRIPIVFVYKTKNSSK